MVDDDIEFEEALPLLSQPAGLDDPGAFSRRRFIQASLAVAGGVALPMLRPRDAAAAELATPLRPDEGVLVLVFLGGGNDGLNTLAPIAGTPRGQYEAARGGLAVPAGALLPVGGDWGLHPKLTRLHQRFRRGRVALVQGTGMPAPDLSHFTATAKVMQGRVENDTGHGWLGRFVDGLPDGDSGLRAMSVGTSVPMFLVGQRGRTTSVPSDGSMWGADRSDPGDALLFDAVSGFADAPSGLGPWGDRVNATGRSALQDASTLSKAFAQGAGPAGLAHDLLVAARLINLDLGARVVGVTVGGYDTHTTQAGAQEANLAMLDAAVETFFANLAPRFQRRTTMLVQSEFGRRVQANGALGTDHGTAAPMLVIGDNVQGGVHAAAPDLGRLDERGNMAPTVDFRAVYASLLREWLRADDRQVLGGSFGGLGLIAAGPGQKRV
jgi:uncharacterized protein (DUF1501 family)